MLHVAWRRNEQQREAELRPGADYLEQPDMPADPEAFITPQMRMIVTSWMCEVAAEYRLQQETLFSAVALLDRFLSTSPVRAWNCCFCLPTRCVGVAQVAGW